MNKLMEWLTKSTTMQKQQLATAAESSVPSLRLAAKGYRKEGELDISAEFAARIELAAEGLDVDVELRREHLCKTCSQCPYFLNHKTP